jgi:hypothetical protein
MSLRVRDSGAIQRARREGSVDGAGGAAFAGAGSSEAIGRARYHCPGRSTCECCFAGSGKGASDRSQLVRDFATNSTTVDLGLMARRL